jgi:DNA-binding response OmpR family regulator
VLVVEDDRGIREALAEILADEGYEVVTAADGDEGLQRYRSVAPDLICLDIMMPGRSGYDVCREIRRDDEHTPILFISARSEEIDKVLGLELGADDFITKPFGVREVVARVRAAARRSARRGPGAATDPEAFRLGDLTVFPAELRARRADPSGDPARDRVIDLSQRDVDILHLFHQRPGQVLDRETLYTACWGLHFAPNSRALDQQISQLRKRIERDPARPAIIKTVHGTGYRYDP